MKIVRLDPERRRIGLSLKQVQESDSSDGMERFGGGSEGGHRVERPALNAELAAQLSQAVSANEALDKNEMAQAQPEEEQAAAVASIDQADTVSQDADSDQSQA